MVILYYEPVGEHIHSPKRRAAVIASPMIPWPRQQKKKPPELRDVCASGLWLSEESSTRESNFTNEWSSGPFSPQLTIHSVRRIRGEG
jgi:hypothetical protein